MAKKHKQEYHLRGKKIFIYTQKKNKRMRAIARQTIEELKIKE